MSEYTYLYCPHLTEPVSEYSEDEMKVELDAETTLCLCKFCSNQVKLTVLLKMMPLPQVVPLPYPSNPLMYRGRWE